MRDVLRCIADTVIKVGLSIKRGTSSSYIIEIRSSDEIDEVLQMRH